jgi:hypothetical protein
MQTLVVGRDVCEILKSHPAPTLRATRILITNWWPDSIYLGHHHAYSLHVTGKLDTALAASNRTVGGVSSHDDEEPSAREEQAWRLSAPLERQLGAFCPLLMERNVVELMLNADGRLCVDRLGRPMDPIGSMKASNVESFIATVASTLRGTVTRENSNP